MASVTDENAETQHWIFCKLFDDMVVQDLCHLRRRELSDMPTFTCDGCSTDKRLSFRRERVHLPRE